jgi:YidC/Oxa1 family membrane protein insertase
VKKPVQGASKPQVDPQKLRKSLLTWAIVGIAIIVVTQVGFPNIWREVIIRPLLNGLLFLYAYLGRNFVIAITALTVLLRLITMPLQLKSIRSTRATSALQPKIAELQKKYGNDKERLVAEQQKLYKEAGVSPFSGCLPSLVQLPIWIGLYQGINSVLADTPVELMNLGKNVYHGFGAVVNIIPLQGMFLGMDLAKPDPTSMVLPVLVAGTTYLQNKMMTQPSGDSQQASMNQSMQLMMPLMFGFFAMQFPAGLAIYFVISNVVGTLIQWLAERKIGTAAVPAIVTPADNIKREKAANGSRSKAGKA